MLQKSLPQRLEHWSLNQEGDLELEQEVAFAIDRATESVGFQYAAPGTVDRRSRHLKEYERSMMVAAKSEGVECNDEYMWSKLSFLL